MRGFLISDHNKAAVVARYRSVVQASCLQKVVVPMPVAVLPTRDEQGVQDVPVPIEGVSVVVSVPVPSLDVQGVAAPIQDGPVAQVVVVVPMQEPGEVQDARVPTVVAGRHPESRLAVLDGPLPLPVNPEVLGPGAYLSPIAGRLVVPLVELEAVAYP